MKRFRLHSSQDCITEAAVLNSTATLLPSGAVLVVTRSGILQHTLPVGVSQVPATVNQDLKAMVPYPRIDSTYVAYALKARERDILETCLKDGTTVQSIDSARLYAFPIPLAPLNEQHRIVAEIETQLTRLDAAVASLERTRANLKRYRAAVLKAACEGRLVPTEAELARAEGREYETRDAHDLPAEWQWTTVGAIGQVQGGIQKQPKRAPDHNHYPFLRVANVLRGRLELKEIHRIELFGQELDRLRLEPDDLLVVEGNGSASEIGRMAIWNGQVADCVHQNHIIRIRLNPGVSPRYVETYWNSPAGSYALTSVASSTSGLFTLSVSKIKSIRVPLPPLPEQERIVAEVERRFSVLDEMEQTVAHGLKRAARLRQAILHKAFTGQLVPQDLDDEPASVLLDRIRAERAAASSGKPTRKPRIRAVGGARP